MKLTLLISAAISVPALLFGLWWLGKDDGAGAAEVGVEVANADDGAAVLAPVDGPADRSLVLEEVGPVQVEQAHPAALPTPPPLQPDPVIGQLVDMLTGEPVPEMGIEAFFLPAMQVQGESLRSDGNGRVELDASLFPGATELRLVEGDGTLTGQKRSIRQSTVPFPFVAPIPVHVGPTFRLDLPQDMIENSWAIYVRFRQLDDTVPENDPIAGLREGETPWIRFPRAVTEIGGGPFEIVIHDRRGQRLARVPVSRNRGIEPDVLRPEFEQRGTARFILGMDGAPEVPAVKVDLEPVGHQVEPDLSLRGILMTQSDGSVSGKIQMLPPGQYRWSVLGTGSGAEGLFQVAAGETVDVTLGMEALGATFDAEVLIDAAAAPKAEVDKWLVMVTNENEIGAGFMTRPEPIDGAPSQYRIPLKAISHGTWRVTVQSQGSASLSPSSTLVTPGAAPEVLRVQGDSGRASLSLTCVDDITGKKIQMLSAAVLIVPKESFEFRRSDPNLMELTTDQVPKVGPVEIFVRAPGYEGAVIVHDASKDPVKRVVRMTPGWRNRVLVLDLKAMAGAADVDVFVEGKKVGVTDANGWCWLEGDAPPLLVEVAKGHPTLDVVGSPYDGGDMAIDPVHGFIFQVMPKEADGGR